MNHFAKTAITFAMAIFSTHVISAPQSNTSSISPAERTKIEEVVHQYLLKNPEVIVEAVQNFQRKQYEQAEQTVKKTQQIAGTFAGPLFRQNTDPVIGNPNGKITIVEFFDYQCPHCVDMAPVIADIVKSNSDVRIIFKDFPIRGPVSEFAARAALAANKQGKYYDFSHAILTAKQPLTEDSIMSLAKSTGLNVDQLKKDMNEKAITDQLKNNIKLAQDLKLFGTPAFFIGKTDASGKINYFPGQMDQKQMQEAIDKSK